MLTHMV